MNVEAKRTRFHLAVCKWMRGLAAAFIAQAGVKNYSEDTAVIDLLALHQDQVLASLAIPLPTFLAAYKAANNLLGGSQNQPSTITSTRRSTASTELPASKPTKTPSPSATPKGTTTMTTMTTGTMK